MSWSNLKIILELLSKVVSFCHQKRVVALLQTGLIILALYMSSYAVYYIKNQHSSDTKRTSLIIRKMGDMVSGCGIGSFATWLTVTNNEFKSERDTIQFASALACVGDNKIHCPASFMLSNDLYNKIYSLSYEDSMELKKTPSNMVIDCEMSGSEINCPTYTPDFLKKVKDSLNIELSNASYVIVKGFSNDTIYIFSLSFSANSIPTCSRQVGNTLLESLARTAKDNL